MYESLLNFPGALFGEFDRLRRELDEVFEGHGAPASIRSVAPGTFPAINVGNTPQSLEVYAFAPGIDPQRVDVTVDRGVLTIAGERPAAPADTDPRAGAGAGSGNGNGDDTGAGNAARVYTRERPAGSFRRAVALPDDADPAQVKASYRDGVLHVSIARRQAAEPTRIAIQ